MMSISPISPDPYKSQAPAPAAPAAPAPGNTDNAAGVLAMLQKMIEEFKKQLENGNLTLTQMKSLINMTGQLQQEMADLVKGQLSPTEAQALINHLKELFDQCKKIKGGMKLWKDLEKQFDAALNAVNIPSPPPKDLKFFPLFRTLFTSFMINPDEASPGTLTGLAKDFSRDSGSSLNSLVASGNTSINTLVNALATGIDELMSAGDNLSQELTTKISYFQNLIEELVKAQGQIEQKFYQTLMQQIKLAQP